MDLPLNRTQLIEIVENSAQLMADTFGLPLSFAGKDGRTDAAGAVTEIDRAVQTKLMETLPGDFMGEEEGQRVTGSDLIWFADPLDGTGAFIRGLASSTCIVTLMHMQNGLGIPVMTVIHNPITRQTWSAQTGMGAYYQYADYQETRCVLDTRAVLPSRIRSTVLLWPGNDFRFPEVKRAVEGDVRFDNQDFGALGTAYATVATGTSHLAACRAGPAYESAAAALLMEESGGVAYDLEGSNLMTSGFPIQDVLGKTTFAIPKGAIGAASEAVAREFLKLVDSINA
jgi:myo-inositol-1(or 4)-monophosphatase